MQLLPVANAFVNMLIDTTNETNGVRGAVKDLAQDGTMTSIFKEAGRAAAAFLDVLSIIGKAIKQVGSSLAVVLNDVMAVAEIAVKAPTALFKHGGVEELQSIWRMRGEFAKAANEDMDQRWGGSMTPFSDNLEKQYAKIGAKTPVKPRQSLQGYTSKEATGPEKADPYQTELNSLGRESAKLLFQSQHIQTYAEKITSAKEAQIQFDIEQGKFKDLTKEQKQNLLEAAKAVDKNAEALRQGLGGLEFEKQTKQILLNTDALTQNAQERAIAAAKQELENKGIKEGTDLYDKLMASRKAAVAAQTEAQNSPLTGFKQGMNDIADQVNNKAASMRNALVGAFNAGADALTEMAMTGKLSFGNFAQSVLKDLVNMIIKQQMFNALAAFKGTSMFGSLTSFLGGGGGTANVGSVSGADLGIAFDGGGFTGAGARSGGLDGKGGFMAVLHPQESVIDHYRGQTAGGSGVVVNVTVNAETGESKTTGDATGMGKLGAVIGSAVRAEIIQQRRPGGLLAA
jgi:lambda family phage tail tape measure protein